MEHLFSAKVTRSDFDIVKVIGRGSFAKVYLVKKREFLIQDQNSLKSPKSQKGSILKSPANSKKSLTIEESKFFDHYYAMKVIKKRKMIDNG